MPMRRVGDMRSALRHVLELEARAREENSG